MRLDGLRKLLQSLVDQAEAPAFDVIVVDNDRGQTARRVAEDFSELLCLQYLVEPERGLARVRNRAVAASNAKFVAFVDDDEWASPGWLASLHVVAKSTDADAVIGPVRIHFGADVPN